MSETITKTSAEAENPGENPDASKWNMRVEDGNNILNDLKSKAKSGFGNVLKRTKEAGLVGLSLGYEGASRAKETLGKAGQMAKEKASELFAQGKEVMIDAKAKAVVRQAERFTAREARRQSKAEAKQQVIDNRNGRIDDLTDQNLNILDQLADLKAQPAEMRQANSDFRDDYRSNKRELNGADSELRAVERELSDALKEQEKVREELMKAKEEENVAQSKLEENPDNEDLIANLLEAQAKVFRANGKFKRVSKRVNTLNDRANELFARIRTAELGMEQAKNAREALKASAMSANERREKRRELRNSLKSNREELGSLIIEREKQELRDKRIASVKNIISRIGNKIRMATIDRNLPPRGYRDKYPDEPIVAARRGNESPNAQEISP